VVDEVAIPDGLEQSIGKAEGENVLRRLLAEKVVDAEDLLFAEDLVQACVQGHGTRQIGAERLLHDDSRSLDEVRLAEHPRRRQRRTGRDAQIVQPATFARKRLLRPLDRSFQGANTGC
jgi:hypothetical protein